MEGVDFFTGFGQFPRARAGIASLNCDTMMAENGDDPDEISFEHAEPPPLRVSPKLTDELHRRYPPEVVCSYIDLLLNATCGKEKKPDCRSVESGLKLLIAYTEGLPIQRQLIKTEKVVSTPSLEALFDNPATWEAFARIASTTATGKAAIKRLASALDHATDT